MDSFKEILWDSLVKAAIARLFIVAPFLGYGPIGVLVSYIITKYSDIFYAVLKLSLNLEQIAVNNEELRIAYNDAAVKLHIIAKDKGIDSSEFKEFRNESKKALSAFVRFDIARV